MNYAENLVTGAPDAPRVYAKPSDATVVVLATGESMSQELADSVKAWRCIAVNDAYKLVPWAEAIAGQDLKWWNAHPEAMALPVPKYSVSWFPGVSRVRCTDVIATGTNSGLIGLHVAITRGAQRVLLLGFDMHGSHFFGPHQGLKNTSPQRYSEFCDQFAAYAKTIRGVEVINCAPGSALKAFPFVDLQAALQCAVTPN